MLILSRAKEEAIVINHNVVIKVLSIDGKKVRLGIEAPNDVSVHRKEIEDRIERDKEALK